MVIEIEWNKNVFRRQKKIIYKQSNQTQLSFYFSFLLVIAGADQVGNVLDSILWSSHTHRIATVTLSDNSHIRALRKHALANWNK